MLMLMLTDFLVVGENHETFDLEGDSGSLIILTAKDGEKPQPIGIIWGGTANRGRLKLKSGYGPENWTSGVDLGRILDLLELDLITANEGLQEAIQEQHLVSAVALDSTVGESSPNLCTHQKETTEEIYEPLGITIQELPRDGASGFGFTDVEFQLDVVDVNNKVEEHTFISMSPVHRNQEDNPELKSLSTLRNSPNEDDLSVSLRLGDREPKRKRSKSPLSTNSPK